LWALGQDNSVRRVAVRKIDITPRRQDDARRDEPNGFAMTVAGASQAGHRVGRGRRRLRRVAGIGFASLLLVAILVVEGRSVLWFGTASPWSSAERIHFCGRDYNRGGVVSAAVAEDAVGASPFQQLTRGPLWQPVYGNPASAQRRASLGVPCAMVLYVREGDGYRSYALSGGP
jgi:hypothetical protein